MGGEIDVTSELGEGSVFTVRVPQGIDSTEVLGAEMAENLEQFRFGSLSQIKKTPQIVREYMPYGRVLVVDDIETNLYVARGLMAPYGLSIKTAISGFEAIDRIKNGDVFDIIFLDHFMPKMDGIETAKIIRELGYTRPMIALTANALAGQAEMFLESGFDGFISKPIDIRQLNASLNKLIRDKYPPEVVEAARQQAASLMKQAEMELLPLFDPELKAVFVRDAENAFARMSAIHSNAFRRSDDIRQFVVDVHAMKTVLANIGETELSDSAFKLEKAGRTENMPVLIAKTPAFLEALSEAIEKNKPKEEDDNVIQEESENDKAYLTEKILTIQTACEDYDEVTANAALAELRQRKWPFSVKELLDAIAVHLLHSDFEKAASIASQWRQQYFSQ
jgi:CheY-like chemotaxis protein